MSLTYHVHELKTGDGVLGCVEGLKAEGRDHLLLHEAMVLLHDVIEVLALPDLDLGAGLFVVRLDARGVRAALVDVDLVWNAVALDRTPQKSQSRIGVSVRCEQEVDGISSLVDGPVQVDPRVFRDRTRFLARATVPCSVIASSERGYRNPRGGSRWRNGL